uniref:Tetraspanin 31 n=1 Tax=Monodelphis domestica TaxID=13616 RepID=A0A5F8G291_MONDO
MVCGGFACSENILCVLNMIYIIRGKDVISTYWLLMNNKIQNELETSLDCFDLFNSMALYLQDYAFCAACCKTHSSKCHVCGNKFLKHSDEALKILGGIGLFFSFTEILGVWLAIRFWIQKDLQTNPRGFL